MLRSIALVSLVTLLSGCRCKGDTKVGEKRAFACGEVPAKDAHVEVDLGDGKRLVRDGVRAIVRGVPDDLSVAVTSFEGGIAELAPTNVSAVFVVGLGGLSREPLARALSALSKQAPLVVAVAGPQDEIDVVRSAVGDAGARVADGSAVRAVTIAGLEVLTLPGSDDPSTLPDHGRGCVLRESDVRALAAKLGAPSKPRVVLAFTAPSKSKEKPAAPDALAEVSAWMVAGPLDVDDDERIVEKGAGALVPIPRAAIPRTTSTPGVIPPGYALVRAEGESIVVRRP